MPTTASTTATASSTLCLITGASRGFGLSCALSLSEKFKSTLQLVLLSRSKLPQELEEGLKGNGTHFKHCQLDLADIDTLEENFTHVLSTLKTLPPTTSQILINNAGSLGVLAPLTSQPLQNLHKNITFNLTSSSYISSTFASQYPTSTIVNVSSLAAITPFKTWGLYCACKSARDMYHKTLALENPNLAVLNYAPGAMDTDMQSEIRSSPTCDVDLKSHFIEAKGKGDLVEPRVSADRLREILVEGNWKNGEHVDYWDGHDDKAEK